MARAKAAATARTASVVPKGMRVLEGGYAKTWNVEEKPILQGEVREVPKTVTLNAGTKKETKRECVEVHDGKERFTLWASATLTPLFERLSVAKDLPLKIWVEFTGYGVAKRGQNAPKLFNVAIGE